MNKLSGQPLIFKSVSGLNMLKDNVPFVAHINFPDIMSQ